MSARFVPLLFSLVLFLLIVAGLTGRVQADVIGSLTEDYIVPTNHTTPGVLESHVMINASPYQAGTKTETVTGTWEFLSRNETTSAFTTMNSAFWYGGKPNYSDDAHNAYGLLFFADYENATGDASFRNVTDSKYPRTAQHANYLFNHPDSFDGQLYAPVVRWTPSADYNCFNSDGNVYFSGEFLAGSNLKFAVIAYDESGTATTLLSRDQSVSNTICSLAITAPKASYYDFFISPTAFWRSRPVRQTSGRLPIQVRPPRSNYPPRRRFILII